MPTSQFDPEHPEKGWSRAEEAMTREDNPEPVYPDRDERLLRWWVRYYGRHAIYLQDEEEYETAIREGLAEFRELERLWIEERRARRRSGSER